MSEDDSIATIRFQNDVSTSYLIAWTTILYWDWLATLPCEVRHLWTAKVSPLKVVFLLQRYGSLLSSSVSLALLLSDLPPHVCGKVFWLETLCLNYVLVTADALLSIRVLALYENSRKAFACLLVLLAFETASLIVAASFVKPVKVPRSFALATDGLGCIAGDPPGRMRRITLLFYVIPFLVNSILLVATLHRSWSITRKLQGFKLPILTRLVHDGALYFLCITAVNAVNIYFYIQPNETIKSTNIAAVITLSSVLSCRLALSLLDKKPENLTQKQMLYTLQSSRVEHTG